ncbi:hypothetical protein [Rhizobium laguerreae]|uniref:hypothetical protein n=1 Tax=Rhizobium laguerreae TaxID=1076926 RepID=UPI00144157DF|nr:hypothetical protein [Rhizobium laguerreae]NKM28212.1 hypothetical protein [Rhizobium laguerreae]
MPASSLGLREPDKALIDLDSAAIATGEGNVSAFRMQVRTGAHVKDYSVQNLVILSRPDAVPDNCRQGYVE